MLHIGKSFSQLCFPLFPEETDFRIDGGKDKTKLNESVSQLMSQYIAALQTLPGESVTIS